MQQIKYILVEYATASRKLENVKGISQFSAWLGILHGNVFGWVMAVSPDHYFAKNIMLSRLMEKAFFRVWYHLAKVIQRLTPQHLKAD